jgi:hypothetical protein
VRVQVFSPADAGEGQLLDLAQQVRDVFEGVSLTVGGETINFFQVDWDRQRRRAASHRRSPSMPNAVSSSGSEELSHGTGIHRRNQHRERRRAVLGTIPTTGAQPPADGDQPSSATHEEDGARHHLVAAPARARPRRRCRLGVELEFDLTKDVLDRDIEDVFKAAEKFSGNTGVGRFFPTAVTATGYTVPSGGALTTNHLVFARGFTNAANNGLKVTTASIAAEIKAAGLVVEAAPPANVTVELAGWRGAVGDITLDGTAT